MVRESATSSSDSGLKHNVQREYAEEPDPLRSPFELDRHRIITSTAFRRLQNKTQVFAPALHDHFRNRLTHTLEVAHIARGLARHCGANHELCEAIALAHDLGHPPFSHAGEKTLNELMAGHGGFNHNAHSVRVVEYLEHPYPSFRGLNLTRATLDGLRAHATQYDVPAADPTQITTLEARIVSLADRIAFNLHDLEDAIGAALILEDQLHRLSLWHVANSKAARDGKIRKLHAVRRPILDAILDGLLTDAMENLPSLMFSKPVEAALLELEAFLFERVYRHPNIARADAENQGVIHELFTSVVRNADALPLRFRERIAEQGPHRVICDYIAGMTDLYCTDAHHRVCRLESQF